MALTLRQQIAHLYRRAGVGATPEELDAAVASGLDHTLDRLLNFEQFPDAPPFQGGSIPAGESGEGQGGIGQAGEQSMTTMPPLEPLNPLQLRALSQEEKKMRRREELEHLLQMRLDWIHRMVTTRRPLQEKLALFWHGHFATSVRKVKETLLMERQIALFRRQGIGNFEHLAQAVSKDPAMIRWLDTQTNNKRRPNENYARELMELFTLGLGNYTEQDVQQAARAFTGWKEWAGEFRVVQRQHDTGAKTFLGRTGNFSGEDIVSAVTHQPATAPFIARKLFAFFGYDNPEPAVVTRLAGDFAHSGYDVRRLLTSIFQSQEFRSGQAYRAKVKSPVELVAGAVKLLRGSVRDRLTLVVLDRMGQSLYDPPSVKGWAGGPAWLNTSSAFDRFNYAAYLVASDKGPLAGIPGLWDRAKAAGASTAVQVTDFYSGILLQDTLPSATRDSISSYAKTSARGEENQTRQIVRMILCTPEFQMA